MTQSRSLVLFDIDGTLLRGAAQHHRDALVEGIRRVTGHLTTLNGVPTSGMLDRDLIAVLLRAAGETESRIRRSLSGIVAECQGCYAASCVPDLSAFVCTGVRQILQTLQARDARLGLVTGNLTAIGWKKVEMAGLREYFSTGAFAEDGRTRKRLAQVAVWRARRQGLISKRARISLIGDHTNDIQAAKENGFQSIAVGTGVTSLAELRAAEPDIVISNLNDLDVEKLL
ncbi:MAG TPA: HAD hydrolase-like protein [Bryobacteraceae bacterium]|jgi:phosphoglycolate phosphatase-like HAD superfamily hydrolase